MAYRVFLSPSDQKKNAYAYGNTNEAEVCGKIAEATKAALMRCGIEVDMTQYEPMSSKCAKSDAFGANLHVPIHTNAYNHQVAGTRIMCSSMSGEGYRAAKAIFDVLAPITPGTSENVSAHPELYEIRVASAPTAYIEVDFHDVPAVAKWLVVNTEVIGEAICHGICNYAGIAYKQPGTQTDKPAAPAVDTTASTVYQSLEDCPAWAQSEVKALMDAGALRGDEKGNLNLTEEMMRTLIICKRYADSK